jgi:hypothetical protein
LVIESSSGVIPRALRRVVSADVAFLLYLPSAAAGAAAALLVILLGVNGSASALSFFEDSISRRSGGANIFRILAQNAFTLSASSAV